MGDNYEITNESEIHSVDNIVSIASEEDILQETSKQIEDLFKEERKLKNLQCEIKNQNEESITENKDRDDKNKLQKQAKTNDIISLEAIAKHSNTQQGGIFNKPSHLLDFEKYLQRQAELAKQKKQFKRYISCEKEKDAIPLKKAKVEVPCSNKRRNVKKSERKKESAKSSSKVVSCNNSESENDRLRKINTKKLLNNNSNSKVNSSSTLNSDVTNDSDSEYFPSDNVDSDEEDKKYATKKKKEKYSKLKCTKRNIKRILDDGDEKIYKQRVIAGNYLRNKSLHSIDNLFKVPQSIWKKLYRYQKVSVLWLWELHGRNLGGLLGDEMGLGKTVQVIAFLAGLDCSELLSDGGRFRGLGPTLIVCPATLMEQWVMHFHEWWPILRVAVLHHSGTYDVNPQILIDSLKTGGVLVTSYSGVLIHQNLLVSTQWHYVILDEGHKIRNPEAKVSKVVKQFSTPHRLLLSGSPMQNSLKELWSLFDFILPGKLGTLPAFLEHCAIPITRGGYANATPLQEATALHVAIILKDAIAPYMLRRTKVDVNHCVNLPEKNEQVLFCSLTDEQTKLYKRYLYSEDISFILHEKNCLRESGTYKARLLIALSALRKICNHPDLFLYTNQTDSDEDITLAEESLKKFGYWKRAGKMIVVQSLLKIWKRQGHRVLLFTQGRQMMHVLESLLQHENYSYLRMDGTTPTSQRQQTIHTFNNNPTYFIFLLTTRVGGLGVNLTGANRVIIYDPDWNPATDAQARERAWRIGQNKKVTVYRLITAGTIEEKIYHRQIFKLLLSNKVLHDPRQRRVFKTTDLAELFNLYEPMDGKTSESDLLFRNSKLTPTEMFSPSKLEKMRQLASTLSKNICKNTVVDMTLPESTSENGTDKEMQSNSVSSKNSVIDIELPENHTLHNDEKNVQNLENNNMINQANINKESKNIENTSQDSTGEITSTISHISNNEVKGPITHNERSIDVEAAKRKIRYKHKRNKNMTKKNDNVSAIFEGERVSCLIGKRMINSPTDKSVEISDDNYVLKKLFAKSSITSAFQHESVLSSAQHDSDNVTPMQRLARESAQESMNFVRSSRKWCTIPRWDKTLPGDD